MFHFFSTCKIINTAVKDYFRHKLRNIKMVKHLKTFDYDVLEPEFRKIDRFFLRKPNLLRYIIKIENVMHIKHMTRAEKFIGDFYIEVHNKNGIVKKLIKNDKLKNILMSAEIMLATNKTDGMYDEKIIDTVLLYNKFNNNNIQIKNMIVNIDIDCDLDLRELLLYNSINVYNYDRIKIVLTNFITCEEEIIDAKLSEFLDKRIQELI